MSTARFYPLLAFGLLVLAILACNGEEAEKVGEAGESETKEEVEAPSFFKVGDVVKKGDQQVTLNSATLDGSTLVCDFTIEAVGDETVHVSTWDFTARTAEGFDLDEDYGYDCDPGIGGEIAPGDKMRGYVCFAGASLPAKVYYEAELFSDDIVFEITE